MPAVAWDKDKYIQKNLELEKNKEFTEKILDVKFISSQSITNFKTKGINYEDPATGKLVWLQKNFSHAYELIAHLTVERVIKGKFEIVEVEKPFHLVPDERGQWKVLWSPYYGFE
jgi:hypothetical protein